MEIIDLAHIKELDDLLNILTKLKDYTLSITEDNEFNRFCYSFFDKLKKYSCSYFKYKNNISLDDHSYRMTQYIDNVEYHIVFNVSEIIEKIQSKTCYFGEIDLFSIMDKIRYREYNCSKLYNNALDTPIIAVYMPSGAVDISNTFYEIMDGNHRVNAAINSDTNIVVTAIESKFLPIIFFATFSDCIVYNCIIGIYNVLFDFESPSQCLMNLDDFFNSF